MYSIFCRSDFHPKEAIPGVTLKGKEGLADTSYDKMPGGEDDYLVQGEIQDVIEKSQNQEEQAISQNVAQNKEGSNTYVQMSKIKAEEIGSGNFSEKKII